MKKAKLLTAFDPTVFSAETHARLEALLERADGAKQGRQQFMNRCSLHALHAWLDNPQTYEEKSKPEKLGLPPERFATFIEETLKSLQQTPGAAKILGRLQALPIDTQIRALSFVDSEYVSFGDPATERFHWKNLSAAYRSILREFPEILITQADIDATTRLAAVFKISAADLDRDWSKTTAEGKVAIARNVLTAAYKGDDIDHLLTIMSEGLRSHALYQAYADTISFGEAFERGKEWRPGMFLTAHEYQHRRQKRAIERLDRGELEPGSADYYQARLFKINDEGGYLSVTGAGSWLTRKARMPDYEDQALEEHANRLADIAGQLGGIHHPRRFNIWGALKCVFYKAAPPLDDLVFRIAHGAELAPHAE